jgi:hypothetical protein
MGDINDFDLGPNNVDMEVTDQLSERVQEEEEVEEEEEEEAVVAQVEPTDPSAQE